ncbi:MAG: sigma-54-dependent Fis family transcriptional regulator [Opitutaceae bacterium]|nr:sigma-54-dependent Fis family transcriptional regulator [Opitutaceae bacterium]
MADASTSPTILVIDDDSEIRYSLNRVLASRGYTVSAAGSGEEGIAMVRKSVPNVVFLDIRMGGMSGLETLQHLRSINNRLPIILMTAFGTAQTAIEAMKFGAFDYIMKPFDPEKVLRLAENAIKAGEDLRRAGDIQPKLKSEDWKEGIVGSSPAMQEVFKTIGQVAASDATVLITGESGTGKELIARCLWQHSHRSRGTFMAVNCAAIPENLIESELFGHEKGSFTGATGQRIGRFEQCDGGTIFLDEIGDMTLPTQTKILRVLQEGEIQRVGGGEIIRVDVRVIGATNKDLEKMVAEKTFREDLYYRLNVVRVRVPALRERMADLPEIVEFMLQKLEKARKTRVRRVSPEAVEVLLRHRWPGNVRELENVIYRSAVVAQGDTILIKDLPPELQALATAQAAGGGAPAAAGGAMPASAALAAAEVAPVPAPSATPVAASVAMPAVGAEPAREPIVASELFDRVYQHLVGEKAADILQRLENEMISRALAQTGGNQARAAELLGITRATLKKRATDLGL